MIVAPCCTHHVARNSAGPCGPSGPVSHPGAVGTESWAPEASSWAEGGGVRRSRWSHELIVDPITPSENDRL